VLHLSPAARKQLTYGGRLRATLKVTFSKAPSPSVRTLMLIAPKHDRKAR
jgi:hypothetical protein